MSEYIDRILKTYADYPHYIGAGRMNRIFADKVQSLEVLGFARIRDAQEKVTELKDESVGLFEDLTDKWDPDIRYRRAVPAHGHRYSRLVKVNRFIPNTDTPVAARLGINGSSKEVGLRAMGTSKETWLANVLVSRPPAVVVPKVTEEERGWMVADENYKYFQITSAILEELLELKA